MIPDFPRDDRRPIRMDPLSDEEKAANAKKTLEETEAIKDERLRKKLMFKLKHIIPSFLGGILVGGILVLTLT